MTVLIAVELKKLDCEGFGVYIDKNRMENDKIFPSKNCFAAFVKKDILDLPDVRVSRRYTNHHQGRAIHMADSRIH